VSHGISIEVVMAIAGVEKRKTAINITYLR
jgi:hypothetical protein